MDSRRGNVAILFITGLVLAACGERNQFEPMPAESAQAAADRAVSSPGDYPFSGPCASASPPDVLAEPEYERMVRDCERETGATGHGPDDPSTTNDESNDQPLRTAGTMTLCVTNHGSGNSYPLDADVQSNEVISIYFPKGGNVDFPGCELDDSLQGECNDEEGRGWTFNGEC